MDDLLVLPIDSDHIGGGASAPVSVIMYGDYTCKDSKTGYHILVAALEELDANLRIIFRNYPRAQEQFALSAAQAAEAAAKQDRFWEMYTKLFDNQDHLTKKDLYNYANELGLDLHTFERDFDSEQVMQKIEYDISSAKEYGVTEVPTYFINGILYEQQTDRNTVLGYLRARLHTSDLTDIPVINTAQNHALDYGRDDPEAYELDPMPLSDTGYIRDPSDHHLYKAFDPDHGITLAEDESATEDQNHAGPKPS